VQRTGRLRVTGLHGDELTRMCRDDRLVRIRHGAYDSVREANARFAHRQLIDGTWPLLGAGAVLSHASAAALHGLPVWASSLTRVSTVRQSGGHGGRRTHLHVRLMPLPDADVCEIDGMRVTSLERTAVDVARLLPFDRAVAVMDAALRLSADKEKMGELIASGARRKGNSTAVAAYAFADPRSESVGESFSRVRMFEVGLPSPTLQFDVHDREGVWVARSDFGWLQQGVVGEFDGRVKYTGTPDEVAKAVMAEKRREQAIRDAGWWVVRWTWQDLDDRSAFRRRILQAFDSAPRR